MKPNLREEQGSDASGRLLKPERARWGHRAYNITT